MAQLYRFNVAILKNAGGEWGVEDGFQHAFQVWLQICKIKLVFKTYLAHLYYPRQQD